MNFVFFLIIYLFNGTVCWAFRQNIYYIKMYYIFSIIFATFYVSYSM